VDDVSLNFREMLDLLNISNDKFIRTTDQNHKKAVQVSRDEYIYYCIIKDFNTSILCEYLCVSFRLYSTFGKL
jgi:hypothetical protein